MEERERLLGYDTGCTAAPGVTTEDRHRALGGSFDANAVSNLLAAAVASRWYYLRDEQVHCATSAMTSAVSAASAAHHGPLAIQTLSDNLNELVTSLAEDLESQGEDFADLASMAALAESQEFDVVGSHSMSRNPPLDIWRDPNVIAYLQSGSISNPEDSRRIIARSSRYQWVNGKLLRKMPPRANVGALSKLASGHKSRIPLESFPTLCKRLADWTVPLPGWSGGVADSPAPCRQPPSSFQQRRQEWD